MKTPRRLLTQETPGPASRFRPTAFAARYGAAGAGRDLIGISGDSKRSIPVGAVGERAVYRTARLEAGEPRGHFFDNNKERDMNDILDRDYEMGIPFDVDEYNERAWARMDESDDEGGKDEE